MRKIDGGFGGANGENKESTEGGRKVQPEWDFEAKGRLSNKQWAGSFSLSLHFR